MRLLAPTEVLMVVVMEWCDLGSLATAIRKQRFRPHGKWTFTSTYVRLCFLQNLSKLAMLLPHTCKSCHPQHS